MLFQEINFTDGLIQTKFSKIICRIYFWTIRTFGPPISGILKGKVTLEVLVVAELSTDGQLLPGMMNNKDIHSQNMDPLDRFVTAVLLVILQIVNCNEF
jgi:hypothetical protein